MKGHWESKARENLELTEGGDSRKCILDQAQQRDSGGWYFITFYDNDLNEYLSHAMKLRLSPPLLGSLVPQGRELSRILLKSAPWC